MNIIEVLKSEKMFRLRPAKEWVSPKEIKDGRLTISMKDLLSEEWEVFEKTVPLTKSQCQKIFEWGQNHGSYSELNGESYNSYQTYLKEIGFHDE